jgi:putative radical SAM enzyme (TIGR03279 family)
MKKKPLTIYRVESGSPAAAAGVVAGAHILSLNGRPVEDALELRFAETAGQVDLVWKDGDGTEHRAAIEKPDDLSLGLEVDPLKIRACNNKCVFCFAHQNARGMRRALYFKDDDYRFSFLKGNFATLTNLGEAETVRIIEQRLSPLYISVHATDWRLRNELLGNPSAPNVLDQIARFAAGRIFMHTQVVLCPGINDGDHLAKTLEDLRRFHPFLETVALVPVGLTQYREKLPVLRSPDPAYARSLLAWAEPRRRRFLKDLQTRFAFPSDEFYLLAERPFPSVRCYEGYAQLGNGVGGCRKFLEEFRRLEKKLPAAVSSARRVSVVTGTLAVPVLAAAIERLNRVAGLEVRLTPVVNTFFGGSVTCAGLLTGADIRAALEREGEQLGETILIPSISLKDDEDIFLDDLLLRDLETQIGRPTVRVESTARGLVEAILGSGNAFGFPGCSSSSNTSRSASRQNARRT